jgi:Restriction endonuclease fold toxin 5
MTTAALPPNCVWIWLGPFGQPLDVLGVCVGPPPPPFPVPAPDLPPLDLPDVPPLAPPDTAPGPTIGPRPDGRVEDRARDRTLDDVCTTGCDACIAAAGGYPEWVSYQNNKDKPVVGTASRGYAYQAFVSGLPHEPENRRNMEWQWAAYSWDGIEIPTCTMLEAKYGYDLFIPYDPSGPVALPGKEFLVIIMFDQMIQQLTEQLGRIAAFGPDVSLKWVFSHQNPMTWFMTLANEGRKVGFTTEYQPFE